GWPLVAVAVQDRRRARHALSQKRQANRRLGNWLSQQRRRPLSAVAMEELGARRSRSAGGGVRGGVAKHDSRPVYHRRVFLGLVSAGLRAQLASCGAGPASLVHAAAE